MALEHYRGTRRNRKWELCERENRTRERRYSLFPNGNIQRELWERENRTRERWHSLFPHRNREWERGNRLRECRHSFLLSPSSFVQGTKNENSESVRTGWGSVVASHSFREQWTIAMRMWEHDQGASALSSSSKKHKGREGRRKRCLLRFEGCCAWDLRYKKIAADEIAIIHTQVATGTSFSSFFLFFTLLFW